MFSNNVELDRLGDTRSFLFRGTELQKELGEGCGDDRQSGEKSSSSESHLSRVARESMVSYCVLIVKPWISGLPPKILHLF